MRLLLTLLLLACASTACQTPRTVWCQGDPELCGWEMAGPGSFAVDGNELRAVGGMGLLWYSEQEYADFRLDLQWKVERKSNNSGIFVRFPDPGDDPWVAVHQGYELQICDTGGERTSTGAVYDIQGATGVETRPVGEWNDYRVEVIGQEYTVTINGKVVNRFTGERREKGYIGLQNHDDGSPVRFRNIRITEL